MSAITLQNDLVHYEVLGRGRPVILLHGWLGSWRYWIPTLQALQASYRVYAIDLYGFGDSGKNPARYGVEQQAAMLDEFMGEMGLPKAAFVGHGLGALVAAELARRSPDKAARLMLASLPLFDTGDLHERRAAPAAKPASASASANLPPISIPSVVKLNPTPVAAATLNASAAMRAALLAARTVSSKPADTPAPSTAPVPQPEAAPQPRQERNPLADLITDGESLLGKAFKRSEPEFDKLQVDVAKCDPKVLRQTADSFAPGRLLDTLRGLPMPIAILHGVDDPILPLPPDTVWSYLTAEKENLVPVPLSGVRHFPMLEYDLFGRLLSDFLEAPDITGLEIKERWRRRTR